MDRQKRKKKRRHTLNDSRESTRQIQIAAAVAATASASNSMIIRDGIVNSPSSAESPVKAVGSRKIASKCNECLFFRYGPAMRRCPMPSPITLTTIKSLFVNLFDLSASVLAHDSHWQLFILDREDTWKPLEDISMVHDHCTLLLVNPAELASVAATTAGAEQLNKTTNTPQPRINGLVTHDSPAAAMVDHDQHSTAEDHVGITNGDSRVEGQQQPRQAAANDSLQSHSSSSVSDTRSSTASGDMLNSTHSLQPSSTSVDSSSSVHSLQPSNNSVDSSTHSLQPNNASSVNMLGSTHSLQPSSTSADSSTHSLQPNNASSVNMLGSTHSLQPSSTSADSSTYSLQPSNNSSVNMHSSSAHSLRRSVTSVDVVGTACSLQESVQQLKGSLAAIRSEHLLRAAELKYDMAITRGSIKGAIASFIRNQGAQCRDNQSFRHKRLQLDPAKEAYIHSSREVLKDLNVLQLLVEEMRIDAVERRCRVKNEELEALAPAVKATLTNIARLRAQYPSLEQNLREVMRSELEVIVQEEKFTEKEMSRIEYALESCRTLAQTMQTLLQFSSIQDKRAVKVPVVLVTNQVKDTKSSMTALLESVGAICPNHETRMRALDYSELVQKRRKQLHNFKKEIWTFEGMLHQKRKQLRHVNSVRAIDRQRQMKLKAMYMEDKVNMDIGQERIRKLVQEKRRYELREKGTNSSEQRKQETSASPTGSTGQEAENSRTTATRQTPERTLQGAEGSKSPSQQPSERRPAETREEEAKRRREERRLERERRYQQAEEDVKRERAQQKQGLAERQLDNQQDTEKSEQQPQASKAAVDENSSKVLDRILERKKERERRWQQAEEEIKREKEQQAATHSNVRRSASMRNEDKSGKWKEKSPPPQSEKEEKPAPVVDRALERKREREQRWQQAEEDIKREKEQQAGHNVRRSASMKNEDKRSQWKEKQNETPVEKIKQPSSPQGVDRETKPSPVVDRILERKHERERRWQQAEEELRREKEQQQQQQQQQQGHSSSRGDSTRSEERKGDTSEHDHSLQQQTSRVAERTPPKVAEKKSQPLPVDRQRDADRQRDSNRESRRAVETGQQILNRMEKKRKERPTDEEMERQAEEELRQINEERKKLALAEKERRKNTELQLMEKQRLALEEERRKMVEEERRKMVEEKHRIHEQQRRKELADRRRAEQEKWLPQWGLLDSNDPHGMEQKREQFWQQIQQQVHHELEEEKLWQHQHASSRQAKESQRTMPRQWREPYDLGMGYYSGAGGHIAAPPTTRELPPYDREPPRRQLSPVYRTASMKEFPTPHLQKSNSEESLIRLKQSFDREIPKSPTLLVSPRKALTNNKSSPHKHNNMDLHSPQHLRSPNHKHKAAAITDIPPTGFHHTYTASQKHKTRGTADHGRMTNNFDSKSLPRSRQHRLPEYDDQLQPRDRESTISAQSTPTTVPRHNDTGFNWHTSTNRTNYPRSPTKRPAPSGAIPPAAASSGAIPPAAAAAAQHYSSAANTPSLKHRHSIHDSSPQRLTHYPHHGSAAALLSNSQTNGDAESQSISYV